MAFLVVFPFAANAVPFSFNYVTDSGTNISGSLNGTVAGNFVIGVTDIILNVNGNNVGPVNVWGYYGEASYEMSFDRTLANFWFADATAWNGTSGGNGAYGFALIGSTVMTSNANAYGNNLDWVRDSANSIGTGFPGNTMNDSWTLTADVPEPGTLALFGLGLAGLAFSRRKKKV